MPLIVDLAAFEGPLDLLLHLIKELKIDIFDIPIVLVTEQYLAYLEAMEVLQLDLASDYLVMAAQLIEIKTRTLLPKPQSLDEEEVEDPRQDLVRQLLAYKQIQEASHILEAKQEQRQLEYPKEASNLTAFQEKIPLAEDELETSDLFMALQKMVARLQKEAPIETKVSGDAYSIQEAMTNIMGQFNQQEEKMLAFSTVLRQHPLSRARVVTLFLALLELVKGKYIFLQQDALFSEINLVRNEDNHAFNESN
ncbi:segregation and condensation protein A [Aerococcus kribbianus]|uniref:Segregation and condensation protein A n=1 Tax=Aerococcus kribbianus TaxID=2999064 RepID=A0A9X3FSN4_9LACT|nr:MULTISPECIES: segregation/condensation protein A [unclassified Aerococcus]MCZ0717662.1 segregation/condensation protein A [Aerococcus sp. YH-aer221]MCZ0725950.1 segregation/condensation protein A [Aerococcus sp. YH-aer222]